jgi:hypothetical protein
MTKREETTVPKVNLGRGFRRILVVVVGLYWLVAAADVTRAYRDAAEKADRPSLAYMSLSDGRVVVLKPYDPTIVFNPTVCQETLPALKAQLAASRPGITVKDDACTVEGIERARSHIEFVEGWNALELELLGWSIAFAILGVIGVTFRWVWRGFVENPVPRQQVPRP